VVASIIMDSYFEHSKARVRPVARVQMSVLSPEEIVSVLVWMVGRKGGRLIARRVAGCVPLRAEWMMVG